MPEVPHTQHPGHPATRGSEKACLCPVTEQREPMESMGMGWGRGWELWHRNDSLYNRDIITVEGLSHLCLPGMEKQLILRNTVSIIGGPCDLV